jgi:hypothetical protein
MASPFTSLITQTLPVPDDDGQTVTIRRLNPDHLHEARKAAQAEFFAALREQFADLGADGKPGEIVRALMSAGAEKPATEPAPEPEPKPEPENVDPLAGYDHLTLMRRGVIGWSYDVERTEENFREWDEERREWIAREVLRLAKPALFDKGAQKKADGALATA